MNRREFLKRMSVAGLVVASPKIIFDLAPRSYLLAERDGLRANQVQMALELADSFPNILTNREIYAMLHMDREAIRQAAPQLVRAEPHEPWGIRSAIALRLTSF